MLILCSLEESRRSQTQDPFLCSSSSSRQSTQSLLAILEADEVSTSPTADSNCEEDMEPVRKLLRKCGKKIDDDDERRRFNDKARRLQAIADPPTDAWLHRHASGVCDKPEKLSVPEPDEVSKQSPSCMREPSVPEKPKESHRTAENFHRVKYFKAKFEGENKRESFAPCNR